MEKKIKIKRNNIIEELLLELSESSDRLCKITAIFNDGTKEVCADIDYFECFASIRKLFPDIEFLCKGSKLNVYPSPMQKDMALGLSAYELDMGKQADKMVDIFSFEDEYLVSDVSKQIAYHQKWLNSLFDKGEGNLDIDITDYFYGNINITQDNIQAILFGVAVGDALGVPVEFQPRKKLAQNPVISMRGFGTYNVPAGSFSDDSSLTFCLAEALTEEFDLYKIANKFINWLDNNYWTATDEVFDVGIATQKAIHRLKANIAPELAGGNSENDNGNGSLMRILPLLIYIRNLPFEERFEITKQVSSITHRHIRSIIACFYYLEFARNILLGKDKFAIYKKLQVELAKVFGLSSISPYEQKQFTNLLKNDISTFSENMIKSNGYVINTLEASIWCLLTTNNYQEAVLKAVNLGEDTDTTAAVTGGLAALLYGFNDIPLEWINTIAKNDEIEDLAMRLAKKYV